jgi:hypothetical protein
VVRGREGILRNEENQSTLCIHIQRQHNETHQTLKKEKGERKKWKYNRKGELVQSTLYICVELPQ